jgi:hypothetical protein
MEHGSRFTTAWESKLGNLIRISHVRDQLGTVPIPGSPYGDIVISFKRPPNTAMTSTTMVAVTSSQPESSFGGGIASASTEIVGGDAAKVDSLVTVLKNAHKALSDDFEQKYAAWKHTWYLGVMGISQKYSTFFCSVFDDFADVMAWTGRLTERKERSGMPLSR